jgi:hypothetical protein
MAIRPLVPPAYLRGWPNVKGMVIDEERVARRLRISRRHAGPSITLRSRIIPWHGRGGDRDDPGGEAN